LDLTLGGPEEVIARDVQRVIDVGGAMGLQLNISMCELISGADHHVSNVTYARVSIADASLLGAPLFSGATLDEAWAIEMFGAQQSS